MNYFGAVGFSNFEFSQLKKLAKHMSLFKTEKSAVNTDKQTKLFEYYTEFSGSFGVVLRGESESSEIFDSFQCLPYALSNNLTEAAHVWVEVENDDCFVIFEDVQSANEIEFQLQNVVDFINTPEDTAKISKVNIAALASSATVLLPTLKENSDELDEYQKEHEMHYRDLMDRARNGDIEANELLNVQEDETIEAIRERLQTEDFLTIVEYYFVPRETKRATYFILGEIVSFDKTTSKVTGETVYKIAVMSMGTLLDVFVNEKHLIGCPICGMRLSAEVWLQGRIVFS